MGESSETKRTKLQNQSNEKVAQMNIDYQKEYNQQVFQREDNANQRAVADMRAAGLNPLANYSPSGSGGVSAAPQSNMHYESGQSKLQENLQNLQAGLSIAESLQNQGLGIQQMQQNNAALQSANMQNRYYQRTMSDRIYQNQANSLLAQEQFRRAQYDGTYRRYYGIHEGDSEKTIRAKILAKNFLDSKGYEKESYATGSYTDQAGYFDYSYNDVYSPDMDKDLYNFASAYGEISDEILDSVKELLGSYLGRSKSNRTEYHNDYSTRNTRIYNNK